MYTVARFLVRPDQLRALLATGETMNAIRPGIFQGPRYRGDGIAVDVADSDRWQDHSRSIISFIQAFKEQITAAQAIGAEVAIDVAVEPEDMGKVPLVLREEPELMRELVRVGISLEISIYLSADRTSQIKAET